MEEQISFCRTQDVSVLHSVYGNFRLVVDDVVMDTQYLWFHYENERGWRWQVLYDKEVEDFTVKTIMPLHEYNNIALIKPTGEAFWQNFRARYESGLDMLVHPEKYLCYSYRSKGLLEWEYADVLPESIGIFYRDITPDYAVKAINGSYMIATYVHPEKRSGITLCYNIMRDDFYAELCDNGLPVITHDLDAVTVKQLEVVLREQLQPLLESLI